MNDRRNEDRLYTAVLLAFLGGLVVIGLLGVPALLVAAVGVVVAAGGIVVFRGFLVGAGRSAERGPGTRGRVPEKYVPSVLEGSRVRRRRIGHLRRHRHASAPLRFR